MAITATSFAYRRGNNRGLSSARQSLQRFKISLILLSISLLIAAITTYLLTTPSGGFDYPKTLSDVQTPEQILTYLQEYRRATNVVTYTLIWFLYAFTVWFLTTLYAFAETVASTLQTYSHSRSN